MPNTIPFSTVLDRDRQDPNAAAYMDEQGAIMDAAVELMRTRDVLLELGPHAPAPDNG